MTHEDPGLRTLTEWTSKKLASQCKPEG